MMQVGGDDASNADDSLRDLVRKKDKIEQEILQIEAWLKTPGNLGLSGGLLDEDGFPLPEVDKIIDTRKARSQLACLNNDHLEIMRKIESKLLRPHTSNSTTHQPPPQSLPLKPFAIVEKVFESSPAEKAGLRIGDQLMLFDTHSYRSGGLNSMRNMNMSNKDRLPIKILRRDQSSGDEQIVDIELVMFEWNDSNRSVGCHLVPTSSDD